MDCTGLCRCTPPPFPGVGEEIEGGSTTTAFGNNDFNPSNINGLGDASGNGDGTGDGHTNWHGNGHANGGRGESNRGGGGGGTCSDLSDGQQSLTNIHGHSSHGAGRSAVNGYGRASSSDDIYDGHSVDGEALHPPVETPAEAKVTSAPAPAPAAVATAVEQMMHALGLGDRMSAEALAATARRYADLMAASREGHAMARIVPVETLAAAAVAVTAADAADGKKRKRGDGCQGAAPAAAAAAGGQQMVGTKVDWEMEMERDLELATLCEHHLLPFHGAVHVAYVLGGGGSDGTPTPRPRLPLPRAALQEIVLRHARRLQVQERLTRDIARDVAAATGAAGVMVAVRASHLCMIARGVEKPGSTTCTSACLGTFAGSSAGRGDFWRALSGKPTATAGTGADLR